MLLEVYTHEKPAVPRRALIAGVALLVVVSALAGAMTCRRSADPLDDRIKLEEWRVFPGTTAGGSGASEGQLRRG
jgi:hypothetical protein